MKKLLSVSAILFTFVTASCAQDGGRIFRRFKGDISAGYASFPHNHTNTGIRRGFIFSLEPKYALLDQFALGLRIETIFLGKGGPYTTGGATASDHFTMRTYGTYLVTADYYFSNNYKVRPFAGAGTGGYYVSTTSSVYDDPYTDSHSTKFGGMIRVGVEIKHTRVAIEYNFVANSTITYNANGELVHEPSKNSYLGIKGGFCFGGGPRKN